MISNLSWGSYWPLILDWSFCKARLNFRKDMVCMIILFRLIIFCFDCLYIFLKKLFLKSIDLLATILAQYFWRAFNSGWLGWNAIGILFWGYFLVKIWFTLVFSFPFHSFLLGWACYNADCLTFYLSNGHIVLVNWPIARTVDYISISVYIN